jgi:hypothetical protein
MAKYKAGDIVDYTAASGVTEPHEVVGPSLHTPPGLILKNIRTGTVFAISAPTVSARVTPAKKGGGSPPAPAPTPAPKPGKPPAPSPTPVPTSPPRAPRGPRGPGFFSRFGGLSFGGGSISGGEGEYKGVGLLFIFALLTHIYDFFSGFQRPGYMLYAYIVLLVIAFFYTFNMSISGGELKLLFVCVLAYFMPWAPKLLPDARLLLIVSGMLFWFPILPVYFGLKFSDKTWVRKLVMIYIAVWCIFVLFWAATTLAPDQSTQIMIKDPMAGARYIGSIFGGTFSKVGTAFHNTVQRAIAQATGQPYGGEEESRVGIYVENVHPVETRYSTESEVFIEATIRAVNVKEFYTVNTICYIDGVSQGSVNPTIMYDVTDNYENIIGCNLGRLNAGTYDVKVRANFEFETTSDITYTFVNANLRSDQFAKLGIAQDTVATYTGGPVELGLPALTQPLRISVDPQKNAQLSTYPFGVSLQNKWNQGKVMKGKSYILDVPGEVKLIDCSRTPIEVAEPDPNTGRNTYKFEMNSTSVRDSFDAVRCRMNFVDVNKLLGSDLKSVKTFAARARYEYAVEDMTTIVVEKN